MANATAQINVRIERELKEEGDRVIESLGLSTSEVVRMLWKKLAEGESVARGVLDGLAEPPEADRQAEVERKLAAIRSVDEGWQAFADLVGLDLSTHVPMTDEELREARYQDLLAKSEGGDEDQ